MEIIGYLAAALTGISLGLIGGGGSILTLPVLVYLFGIAPAPATSYSLFIVGITSLIGAWNSHRKQDVSMQTAFLFGLSSILTVFLTRKFLLPAIPEKIFLTNTFYLTKSLLIMMLFAVLMLAAAVSMISDREQVSGEEIITAPKKINFWKLLLYGLLIGIVTGLLGAGGGFLLIPALVILVGLPMKKAIGTSLLIIALNSLIGFMGDIGHFQIDWIFLLKIAAMAIAGILVGGLLSRKISGEKLKVAFGWFVGVMAVYIIIHELFIG
ncbi:sulfite exporter TauE/SafE family protein [Chitinophaga sp. MM2321]|uniref:sulfite exporter TauE/SafE family protein n=1 Tax=Chitinophaga sp. MM2321 TaxID=3137178 RepID=UPI0032D5A554